MYTNITVKYYCHQRYGQGVLSYQAQFIYLFCAVKTDVETSLANTLLQRQSQVYLDGENSSRRTLTSVWI
jgi:hypothetical protein